MAKCELSWDGQKVSCKVHDNPTLAFWTLSPASGAWACNRLRDALNWRSAEAHLPSRILAREQWLPSWFVKELAQSKDKVVVVTLLAYQKISSETLLWLTQNSPEEILWILTVLYPKLPKKAEQVIAKRYPLITINL